MKTIDASPFTCVKIIREYDGEGWPDGPVIWKGDESKLRKIIWTREESCRPVEEIFVRTQPPGMLIP